MISRRRAWGLSAAWALVIFALSSLPGRDIPAVTLFANADKVAHVAIYAVLGLLCLFAVRRTWTLPTALVVLTASLIATAYGVTDELHQILVPGRSADPRDVAADAVGALIGCLAATRLSSRSP